MKLPAITPGPWRYGSASNYEGFYIAPQNLLPTLAACAVHNFPDEAEANAKAIAAVPVLLEELANQADGCSTIIALLGGQSDPVAASLVGMLRMQERAAIAALRLAGAGE